MSRGRLGIGARGLIGDEHMAGYLLHPEPVELRSLFLASGAVGGPAPRSQAPPAGRLVLPVPLAGCLTCQR